MLFKITTFNLRLNVSSDKENAWPYRVNSVVKYIDDTNPFIIGTQEVTDRMLSDLTIQLPKYDHIGLTRVQNEEASSIFYNKEVLEVKEYGTFWLSKTPEVPNSKHYNSACVRICTWGEFIFKENRNLRFRVFNTHLDHISDLAKIEGMKTITKKMNLKANEDMLPTILMGDFNSTVNDEVIKYLNDDCTTVGSKPLTAVLDFLPKHEYGATFHYFTGLIKGDPIDHIYVTKDIKV
ncbi:MAG: endonuclease, partial [Haloplasmataceae bacterium]|nr:endonuclease [Haloplasmataceae bacterium]